MPERPTTEPTERSMPAVRITNVSPMARIAHSEACLTMSTRLSGARNRGERSEKPMISRIRTANARSWTRTTVATDSRPRLPPPLTSPRAARRTLRTCMDDLCGGLHLARRGVDQKFLGCLVAGELGRDRPLRHDAYPIRDREHLEKLRGYEDDALALPRERADEPEDLGLCAD